MIFPTKSAYNRFTVSQSVHSLPFYQKALWLSLVSLDPRILFFKKETIFNAGYSSSHLILRITGDHKSSRNEGSSRVKFSTALIGNTGKGHTIVYIGHFQRLFCFNTRLSALLKSRIHFAPIMRLILENDPYIVIFITHLSGNRHSTYCLSF